MAGAQMAKSRRVASVSLTRAEHHPDLLWIWLACVIIKAISFPRTPCRPGLCMWHAAWVQLVHRLLSRISPYLPGSGNMGCVRDVASGIVSTWGTSCLGVDGNDGAVGMHGLPSASHTDFSRQIFRGGR